jgi:hypothetical protein
MLSRDRGWQANLILGVERHDAGFVGADDGLARFDDAGRGFDLWTRN